MSAMTKKEWMEYLEKTWDAAQKEAWSEPQFECPRYGHCCQIQQAAQQAVEVMDAHMMRADTDEFYEAKEALRQALAQPEQEPVAWQPIESAPKTGRKVILSYKNRLNVGRTVIARWLTDEQATEIDGDDVGLEGGWYECIDNWDDYTEVAIHEGEPSHWMPLPAPPIEALRQALETFGVK